MIRVCFYNDIEDNLLKLAVIIAKCQGNGSYVNTSIGIPMNAQVGIEKLGKIY